MYNQVIDPLDAPYAQRLKPRCVIVGETCLDKQNAPQEFVVKKTFIYSDTHILRYRNDVPRNQITKRDNDLAFTSPGHSGLLSDQHIGSPSDSTTNVKINLNY